MKEEITAYITKYALTKGIIMKVQAEICLDAQPNGTMISVKADTSKGEYYDMTYHKGEWWKTPETALAKVSAMKFDKLKNLRKQIKKIEDMTFKIE